MASRSEIYAQTVAAKNALDVALEEYHAKPTISQVISKLPKPLASDTTQSEKIEALQDLEARTILILSAISDYAAKLQLLETVTVNPKGLESLD